MIEIKGFDSAEKWLRSRTHAEEIAFATLISASVLPRILREAHQSEDVAGLRSVREIYSSTHRDCETQR